jgi:hypothetical protein
MVNVLLGWTVTENETIGKDRARMLRMIKLFSLSLDVIQ